MQTQLVCTDACEPECENRREKHVDLADAIENMITPCKRIKNIIARIEGPTPESGAKELKSDKNPPTLLQVLENGPTDLRQTRNFLLESLDKLEELLF